MSAVAPLPRRRAALPRRLLRLRSDAALGERFATGDDTAFAVLYERHAPSVLAVCIGILADRQEAEDATQETFAALAVGLRSAPPDELRPWLVRVARNASIDLLRRRRAKPTSAATAEELDEAGHDDGGRARAGHPVPGIVDLPIRTELQSVLAGIRELPASQRTALLLRELAGHSYAEIGALLEIDEQAVRGLIARARAGLRNYREATELPCAVARAEIADEPDGRRYDRTVRRHLRRCEGCQAYRDAIRGDAQVLRGLTPLPAGGLAGGGAFVGLAAKGFLTGGVLGQAGAVCAVSVCSVGGAVLLYPHALAVLGHHGPLALSASRGTGRRVDHDAQDGSDRRRAGSSATPGAAVVGLSATHGVGLATADERQPSGLTTAGRGTVRPAGVASAGTRTGAGTLTWTARRDGGAGDHRSGRPLGGSGDGTAWDWGRGRDGGGSSASTASSSGADAGARNGEGDGANGQGSADTAGDRGSSSAGAGTAAGAGSGAAAHPTGTTEGSVGATPVVATGGAGSTGDGTDGAGWRSPRAESSGAGQEDGGAGARTVSGQSGSPAGASASGSGGPSGGSGGSPAQGPAAAPGGSGD